MGEDMETIGKAPTQDLSDDKFLVVCASMVYYQLETLSQMILDGKLPAHEAFCEASRLMAVSAEQLRNYADKIEE